MRLSNRKMNQLRDVVIHPHYLNNVPGSCLITVGQTHVMCCATLEEKAPPFLRNTGKGWITAEYGMLPCSTHTRMDREAVKGRQTGRTQEIQRLIGRALRSVVKLDGFGEKQIRVDCDVIQADGGTRMAGITGGFVALHLLFQHMKKVGGVAELPINNFVAGISCGLYQGHPIIDLDYQEDSTAQADANFVITDKGGIVEIQGTAEQDPFDESEFNTLLEMAREGCDALFKIQRKALQSA